MNKLSMAFLFWGAIWVTPFMLHAQTQLSGSGSVSVSVNARVVKSIELTTLKNMRFGRIEPGQQVINISPLDDPKAGKMIASGIPNAPIRLSYIKKWELSGDRSSETLTFLYSVSANEIDNQATAELLEADNRNLHFNAEGRLYLWIGGYVNIADAPPGNYEGEFTIEIEYI